MRFDIPLGIKVDIQLVEWNFNVVADKGFIDHSLHLSVYGPVMTQNLTLKSRLEADCASKKTDAFGIFKAKGYSSMRSSRIFLT